MPDGLTAYALGAALNLLVAALIVRLIYYPQTHEKRYVLTFLAFNTVIYFVLTLLNTADLSVGVGFGLFAIFSVLRYRTDPIPIREMTYLFVLIALPVVNSVLSTTGAFWKLVIADGTLVLVLYVLEREWGFRFEGSARICYDRIALIVPAQREQLLADLRERTGLPVKRVEIGRLDFLRDSADLRVFYDAPRGAGDSRNGVVAHNDVDED
ncbi:MAG: DUF4956 domain-containing protein [Chloroflexi bacterium]|nr:DUF4956 domain-containing protein [Chloroflexota bacterium]